MNKILSAIIVLLIIAFGGYYWYTQNAYGPQDTPDSELSETPENTENPEQTPIIDDSMSVLGQSAGGHDIRAYHFGEGEREVLFVGGMHGGYSWNTALLAYELMDYLERTPSAVPEGVKVTVLPVLNPDGLQLVAGTTTRFSKSDVSTSEPTRIAGRFNGNDVDLNRNFDCEWKESAKWQNKTVSAGTSPFSEPESKAFRGYIEEHKPHAVVVWYSSAGGVFPSTCDGQPSADSFALTDTYAKASGYKAFNDFDFYEITGDMPNWLSTLDIPAISVLLTTHDSTEWTKNQKGIDAILMSVAR